MTKILRPASAALFVLFGVFSGCGDDSDDGGTSHGGSSGNGGSKGGASGASGKGGSSGKSGGGGEGGLDGDGGTGGRAGSGAQGGSGATGARGGEGGEAGGGDGASGGAGGDAGDVPPTVTEFGCFALSGDGWDFLDGGVPASVIPDHMGCGTEVSSNPGALAPEAVPTSFGMTRKFVLDQSILDTGVFTLSFGADDAVAFTLNGEPVASCDPPSSDIGACSETECRSVSISRDALRGNGEVNTLDIEVTNLLSIDAGGGNFGYTGAWYSLCAAHE